MTSRNFLDLVDHPSDRAVRAGARWVYSCGLELVEDSIKVTLSDHYVTRGRDIIQRAHTAHHLGEATKYVRAGTHDIAATLYFQSRKNERYENVLINAFCSCGYDPLA